jgi:hypothetical protein
VGRIQLTQELLHETSTLDADKGALYWKVRRPNAYTSVTSLATKEKERDVPKKDEYWHIRIKGKSHKRFRIMLLYANGYSLKEGDHRDRNRLNDRPSALRAATRSGNASSIRGRSGNYQWDLERPWNVVTYWPIPAGHNYNPALVVLARDHAKRSKIGYRRSMRASW